MWFGKEWILFVCFFLFSISICIYLFIFFFYLFFRPPNEKSKGKEKEKEKEEKEVEDKENSPTTPTNKILFSPQRKFDSPEVRTQKGGKLYVRSII